MAAPRRRNVVPTRRRRHDDVEEEGSVAADAEDDSLSEGSAISDGDEDANGEGSDNSGYDDDVPNSPTSRARTKFSSKRRHEDTPATEATESLKGSSFKHSADTEAMLHGLQNISGAAEANELHFDDAVQGAEDPPAAAAEPQTHPESKTVAGRREQLEKTERKSDNPTFVPNGGGFFLHDNRHTPTGPHGPRFSARGGGRGRGPYHGSYMGRGTAGPEPTDRPWVHDLHESATKMDVPASAPALNSTYVPSSKPRPSGPVTVPGPSAPNRSFSSSTVLGNVTVQILLPGSTERKLVPNVAKKQHTLLPEHRPPLRRDKPVRISLPDHSPRYIFPSVERSFIFIPRALRPNQQPFGRGRGRGSFHGSRRTSVFGGSNYSPSVGMSRKSSIGGLTVKDDLRSPVGTGFFRPAGQEADALKPVVRLPAAAQDMPGHVVAPGMAMSRQGSAPMFVAQPFAALHQAHPGAITIHQPRPQKTVSIADIESPTSYTFKPPQQQQEQPFHQQVPLHAVGQPYMDGPGAYVTHSRQSSRLDHDSRTPLSHIPERAIYAQPFQPYPAPQLPGYFGAPYPPGAVFYPSMPGGPPMFPSAPMLPPSFVPGATPGSFVMAPPPAASNPSTAEMTAPPNMVAHESNGMVYYYNSSQMPATSQSESAQQYGMAPAGGVVGIGGMMTPPAQFYYPPGGNGVYFAAQ